MPRATPLFAAFNTGEVSPLLWARSDLEKYRTGCRSVENMLPLAQGALTRRPGTRFVSASKSNGVARLIPFQFSTVQAYVIEAGAGYLRFFKDDGLILSGGAAYEVSTPYAVGDLPLLQWTQSADTMYLTHPSYAPRKLTRTGHAAWTLAAISFTATPAEWTGANWPGSVTFYGERLFWGGVPGQPQTVWSSKVNDFENMTTGAAAADALKFTLVDDQMNAIRWLKGGRTLLIGTAGGEFSVQAANAGEALTPSNITARRQSTNGSASVGAVQIGQAVVHAQRAGRKLLEIAYSFESDAYAADELNVLAGHMLRGGVKEMAWAQEPWRVLWVVLADGGFVGFTYMKAQSVMAWHRHPLAGAAVKVLSVAVIPSATADDVWLLVERTIGGATKRYVERMAPEFWGEDEAAKAGAWFVDAGLSYSGAAADVIGSLDHLAGQTVTVLADGAAHPDRVVSAGGEITLQRAASKVVVGLGYRSRVETLDIEAGAADGTAQTRRRRIHEVGVLLHQSLGGKVGYAGVDGDALEEMQFRVPSMPMNASPPLFSGEKVVSFPSRWDRAARVVLVQEQPFPLTVTGLVPRLTTND